MEKEPKMIKSYTIGTKIEGGVINAIIFPSFCYMIKWDNGQVSHAYHHELKLC